VVDVGGVTTPFGDEVIISRSAPPAAGWRHAPAFLVDAHRPLPDRGVKFIRAPDCRFPRSLLRNDLDSGIKWGGLNG